MANAPFMVLPNRVLADSRLLVDYASDFDNMVWTVAIVTAGEVQVIESYPEAALAAILH